MLPLILALGGAALSAKQAQDEKKDARRMGDMDALIQSGKTAYSGFTGGPQGELKAMASGPSVMGNALAGGVAGYSQGQAFDMADAQRNAYAALLAGQKQNPQARVIPNNAYSVGR